MAAKPRVVVTWLTPGLQESALFEQCEVDVWPEDRIMPKDLLAEKVRTAEGLYTTPFVPVNEALLYEAVRHHMAKQREGAMQNSSPEHAR